MTMPSAWSIKRWLIPVWGDLQMPGHPEVELETPVPATSLPDAHKPWLCTADCSV